jgi:hypothetical protein
MPTSAPMQSCRMILTAMAKRERGLQAKEEEVMSKHECERGVLKSCADGFSAPEATLEAKQECLRKTRDDLCNCELTISSQEGTLEHHAIALTFTERELADTEKRLEEASLQELAATCRVVEELQAAWAIETQKV